MNSFWGATTEDDLSHPQDDSDAKNGINLASLDRYQLIQYLIAMFGLFYLLVVSLKFAAFLLTNAWKWRRQQFERYNYYIGQFTEVHGEDTWAVISGGANDFGVALGEELAGLYGFNICIIDQEEDVITEKLMQIRKKHKVKVRSIKVDFREYTALKEYESIVKDALYNIHIGLLIINTELASGASFRKMTHLQV